MAVIRVLQAAGAALVLGAVLAGTGVPASADCSGPSFTYDTVPVRRGETLTVYGTGFGTRCYDLGTPPAGEAVLGPPATNIEIVLSQGSKTILAGRVDAGAEYDFKTDVIVPAEFEPGIARVTVAFAGVVRGSKDLEITGEAPRASSATTTLAPSTSAPRSETPSRSTDPSETSDGDHIGTPAVLVAITVALVAAIGGAIFVARRR